MIVRHQRFDLFSSLVHYILTFELNFVICLCTRACIYTVHKCKFVLARSPPHILMRVVNCCYCFIKFKAAESIKLTSLLFICITHLVIFAGNRFCYNNLQFKCVVHIKFCFISLLNQKKRLLTVCT